MYGGHSLPTVNSFAESLTSAFEWAKAPVLCVGGVGVYGYVCVSMRI